MDQYQCRGNFWRTFRTIGPYEFPQEKVWTNDWSSIQISPKFVWTNHCSKFSESFSLDRYGSIEGSSLSFALFGSQTKGRERKGPPEIIQKFRLRRWPISSADFLRLLCKEQSTILAFLGRRLLGQYPAAPSSPDPFALLLICVHAQDFARLFDSCGGSFPRTSKRISGQMSRAKSFD